MKTPTINDITPGIKAAVGAMLIAQAHAQTVRGQVDEVGRELLKACPLPDDSSARRGEPGRFITDPKYVYHCSDEILLADHYAALNHELRKRGIKPAGMADDYCPACVAESVLLTARRAVVELTGPLFGVNWPMLCRYMPGKNKMALVEWCDLWAGLIVNLPGFKNPMTV
jgi:hypothetical protein